MPRSIPNATIDIDRAASAGLCPRSLKWAISRAPSSGRVALKPVPGINSNQKVGERNTSEYDHSFWVLYTCCFRCLPGEILSEPARPPSGVCPRSEGHSLTQNRVISAAPPLSPLISHQPVRHPACPLAHSRFSRIGPTIPPMLPL